MKKSLILMLLMIVVLSLFNVAFGDGPDLVDQEVLAIVQADVDETNAIIDHKINDAVYNSILIVDGYNNDVLLANSELTGFDLEERLTSLFNNKEKAIENLIDVLVDETDEIAQAMFDRAEALGVEVLCELVPVEIDGRIVMVDPIKVVGV